MLSKNLLRIILPGLFGLAGFEGYCQQEYLRISGTIYDSVAKAPLESAYIYFPDTPVGTVSSKLGEFDLNIPKNFVDRKIKISFLGYKSQYLPASGFREPGRIIFLAPVATLLEAVSIKDQPDSGAMILEKATKAIGNNYPSRKHLLEGFYRELSVKDTSYTRLIEASILVQENGYNRAAFNKETLDIDKSRVQIQELRKSNDYRTYDNFGKGSGFVFGTKNDLYEILEDNYLRFLGTESPHFLSDNFLSDYDIHLAGHTQLDGEPVYIVELRSTADLFFIREVDFYIGKKDHAFLRIENSLLINRKDPKLVKTGIYGKYFYHSDVSYRRIGQKYVPFLIRTQKYASNTNPVLQTGSEIQLQYMDLTFLLTDFSEENFNKIRRKVIETRGKDLNEIEWSYNKLFWDNYNLIKLHPLNAKVKSHLERETDLESQFNKN